MAIEGEHRTWRRAGDSGRFLTFHFCPTCGSTVFWEAEGTPDCVTVAVGAFADPGFPAPVRTVWAENKHGLAAVPGTRSRVIRRTRRERLLPDPRRAHRAGPVRGDSRGADRPRGPVRLHPGRRDPFGLGVGLRRHRPISAARRCRSRAGMAMVEAAGGRDLPPERRTPGTCRDFALMTCSALRERGVPARVRCGFATYFPSNPFEDHWVCEHWRGGREPLGPDRRPARSVAARALHVAFDPTDLPAKTFLNAGEAWTAWRSGEIDATTLSVTANRAAPGSCAST